MALKDGDVVRFDYTLYVDGKIHETSDEALAKDQRVHREGHRYQPLTVTLGSGQLIRGLESHFRSHGQAGQPITADVAAADAYGERDPKKIQTIPMGKFKAKDVEPYVGLRVNVGDGVVGTVTNVAGGRVRVDTNHVLAGKALRYEYTIREVIDDEAGKVQAVLDGIFGNGKAKAAIGSEEVAVEIPPETKFDQAWTAKRFRLASRLRIVTNKAKAIKLVEVFPDETGLVPGHEGHNHGPEGHGGPDHGHHGHHGHDHGHDHGHGHGHGHGGKKRRHSHD